MAGVQRPLLELIGRLGELKLYLDLRKYDTKEEKGVAFKQLESIKSEIFNYGKRVEHVVQVNLISRNIERKDSVVYLTVSSETEAIFICEVAYPEHYIKNTTLIKTQELYEYEK